MAITTTPWGKAIDDVLEDGEWHTRDELIAAGAAAVPPGVAYREGERRRMLDGPPIRTRGDQADAVAAGARNRAIDTLRSRVRFGTVEVDDGRYRKAP